MRTLTQQESGHVAGGFFDCLAGLFSGCLSVVSTFCAPSYSYSSGGGCYGGGSYSGGWGGSSGGSTGGNCAPAPAPAPAPCAPAPITSCGYGGGGYTRTTYRCR